MPRSHSTAPGADDYLHMDRNRQRHMNLEFRNLEECGRYDSTVAEFIDGWKRGYFCSCEQMLVRLSCQLASEKAATKAIQTQVPPSIIINKSD